MPVIVELQTEKFVSQEAQIDRIVEGLIGDIIEGRARDDDSVRLRELAAKRSMLMTRPTPSKVALRRYGLK